MHLCFDSRAADNCPAEFSGSANAMVALPGDVAIGNGTRTRLQAQLSQLLAAINRLEYYVGLLEEDAAMLIRAKYFEQRSWPDMVKHFGRPRSTLYDCVATGLDALSRMFDYADDFSAEEIQYSVFNLSSDTIRPLPAPTPAKIRRKRGLVSARFVVL